MDNFVSSPNLPKKAGLILIGEKYFHPLKNKLEALGVDVLSVPANPMVDPRLSSHADLSLLHAGNACLFAANFLKNSKFAEILAKINVFIDFCAENQSEQYPFDAGLNICCVGKHFVYNPKVSDETAVLHLRKQGRVPVSCRQGYCKCSVCVVDEKSIICADKGINMACKAAGLDVLEIRPGYVALEGFDYGFIGGASFKLSTDKLAFTGTLDAHPDKEKIYAFLKERGVEAVFLTDLPLFDIGSAVVLTEKEPKT